MAGAVVLLAAVISVAMIELTAADGSRPSLLSRRTRSESSIPARMTLSVKSPSAQRRLRSRRAPAASGSSVARTRRWRASIHRLAP